METINIHCKCSKGPIKDILKLGRGGKDFHAKGRTSRRLLAWKAWQMKGNWERIDGKRGKREINEMIKLKN